MDAYKFSVAVGGNVPIPVKGNFIRYKEVTNGAAASAIRIKTDGGDTLVMDPNDKARLSKTFTRIEIENYDATETIAGLLMIGEGDFDSAQVTGTVAVSSSASRLLGIVYGSLGQLAQVLVNAVNYLRVQVQGRGDAETDAGAAFTAHAGVAGTAANYSHTQLMNPAGSGKVVYLDKITVWSNADDSAEFCTYDTQLTTLANSASNRDTSGANGVSKTRVQNNGTQLGTRHVLIAVKNGVSADFVFDPPIKIAAGKGVLVRSTTVNVTLNNGFYFREYSA